MARYQNPTQQQFVSQFVPEPLEFEQNYFDNLQKRQDTAQLQVKGLEKPINFIPTTDEANLAQNTKYNIENKLNELSGLDINDPLSRDKYIKGIKDIKAQYEPGGQAYTHNANYEAYQNHIKYLDDVLKKKPEDGGINIDTYNYLKAKSLNDFGSSKQINSNQYNQYKGSMPALNPDIDKQVQEATKDWKSNAISKGYWTDKEGKQWAVKNSSDIESIDPNEIKASVLPDILNKPENKDYAEQQTNTALYNGKINSNDRVNYYNNFFTKPVDLAAARLGFTKAKYDQDIKGNEVAIDKLKKNEAASPMYTTPAVTVQGMDYGDSFDLKKKGSSIPYTEQEAQGIYKKWNTSRGAIGNAATRAEEEINAGKQRTINEHEDINTMPESTKNFSLSALKYLDKDIYDKVANGGKLTEAEKAKYYPQLKEINDIAKQSILASSTVIGLSKEKQKQENYSLFGSEEPTIKDLGTGNAVNVKIYDPETDKAISSKDFKEKFNDEDRVTISGKLTSDNAYSFLTHDDAFANGKQINVNGKDYIVSGPKEYVDPNTGSKNIIENKLLYKQKEANKIANTRFIPTPSNINIYNKDATVWFKPNNKEDRTKGTYQVTLDGNHEEFNTAEEAEQFIADAASKSESKK